MTTPLIREGMSLMLDGKLDPVDFMWFDISTDKSPDVGSGILTESRPPFDRCVVMYRSKVNDSMMCVFGDDPSKGVIASAWMGPVGKKPTSIPPMVYVVKDGIINYGASDPEIPISEPEAKAVLSLIALWYRMLASSQTAYRPEVAPTFTNRRKIAQGKKLSYDWHTVVIEPQQPKSASMGGTHASPRLHDRRGHLRKYKSGKTGWVKNCKVGNASLGTVFHDYEVRA